MNVGALRAKLSGLATRTNNWHENHFVPTRKKLYVIHSDIYDLSLTIEADQKLVNELNSQLNDKDIKYNRNSSVRLKLVKLAFHKIDRRKASSYAIPMDNAKDEGVPAGGYVKWLTKPFPTKDNGEPSKDDTYSYVGIVGKRMKAKEIKLDNSKSSDKLAGHEAGIELMGELTAFDAVKSHVNTPAPGSLVVLVGRVNQYRQTEVVTVLNKEELVNSALEELVKQNENVPIENTPYEDVDEGEVTLTTPSQDEAVEVQVETTSHPSAPVDDAPSVEVEGV